MYSLPQDIQVDVEVGVNQPVAHTNDIIPRNVLELLPRDWRDLVGRLTDDLDILDQCKHSIRLLSRSDRRRPWAKVTASRAASSICRKRMTSSRRILHLCLLEHALPEIAAQIFQCVHVHFPPAEQGSQFPLHASDAQ